MCIEGLQFSTRAESNLYQSWGAHVVGMTNLPEARLARECELPYATVALVTDYDCWKVDEAPVTVDAVIAVLKKNVAAAQAIVREVAAHLPDPAMSPPSRMHAQHRARSTRALGDGPEDGRHQARRVRRLALRE